MAISTGKACCVTAKPCSRRCRAAYRRALADWITPRAWPSADGSYYVSGIGTGVVHFSNSGVPLGVLGSDVLVAPGTLAFGPNGNLYVS